MYRPAPVDFEGLEEAGRSEVYRLAQAAGLDVIDLTSAFESVADRSKLILAEWDHHTNTLGHRLLAERFYHALVPLLRLQSETLSSHNR